MKIIKPGREQQGWAKEFNCTGEGNEGGGCGAVLLVEEADLFTTTRCCMGETDTYVTFRCAQCGVLTDIENYPKHHNSYPSMSVWLKRNASAICC